MEVLTKNRDKKGEFDVEEEKIRLQKFLAENRNCIKKKV